MFGFLSKLFERRLQIDDDRFWQLDRARMAGIRRQLEVEVAQESVAVLLVAHFPKVHEDLQTIAREASSGRVRAVLVDELHQAAATTRHLDEEDQLDIIVADRHPLISRDQIPLVFAKHLECRCRYWPHYSGQNPMVSYALGANYEVVLAHLGVAEEDFLQSRMVNQRVRRGQQRVARLANGDTPTHSVQEWMDVNCPKFRV